MKHFAPILCLCIVALITGIGALVLILIPIGNGKGLMEVLQDKGNLQDLKKRIGKFRQFRQSIMDDLVAEKIGINDAAKSLRDFALQQYPEFIKGLNGMKEAKSLHRKVAENVLREISKEIRAGRYNDRVKDTVFKLSQEIRDGEHGVLIPVADQK